MDIKALNENLSKALNETDEIQKIVDAINAEMEHQRFQNMGVDVDESAYEPSITIFTHWFDEYSEKQADLINEKFNVFKTTEHLGSAEVYTESDVNTLRNTDGETKSEGNVSFVAIISPDAEITDAFADEVAREYVQQMTNFWDEVYASEMLEESINEDLSAKANKLISAIDKKIATSEYRGSTILGVKNLSRADLESIKMYAEMIRDTGSFDGFMRPMGAEKEVLQKAGLLESFNKRDLYT